MCRFFFTPTDWGHGSVLCQSFQGLRKEEKKGNRDTKKLSDPFQSLGRVWISPDLQRLIFVRKACELNLCTNFVRVDCTYFS